MGMGGVQSGLYNNKQSATDLGNLPNKVSLTEKETLGYPYCKGNLKRYKAEGKGSEIMKIEQTCAQLVTECKKGPTAGECTDPREIFGDADANEAHWGNIRNADHDAGNDK